MNLSLPKTFTKFLFITMLFLGQFATSQVVIARQDFESTPASPTMTFTTSNIGSPGASTGFSTGSTTASDSPQSANLFSEGARGYRIQGPSSGTAGRTLLFSDVNTSGYTGVAMNFKVAGMSIGSTANGIDTTIDEVLVEISPDGGTTWYQQAKVNSSIANGRWVFSATGSGSRAYIASNAFSIFSTTANVLSGTANTAITSVTITSLPSVTNLKIRISAQTNSPNESWILDDVRVTGTLAPVGPTVTTTTPSSITTNGAVLNGTINANGTTTDASFQYGTTVAYGSTATATPSTATGTSATSISATIGSLSLNTQYHYRAVGSVSAVPTNGNDLTFYTLAATPGVVVVNNPFQTTLDVTVNATTENGNPATTEYAIQETGGQYVQANGTLGVTPVWRTASVWATTTLTGLTTATTYTFQAKARNGANVETAFGGSTSGTTLAAQLVDYAVVQFPNTTQTILEGGSVTVYIRAYEPGLTTLSGAQANLFAWVGYSSTNDNPFNIGWTWVPATFNVEIGNDDEYQATLSGLPIGTYYYAARFQIGTGPFVYGGSSGVWNNNNVTLNVNADVVDFANIQFPTTATITEGETETIFAQVYETGVTEGAGQGTGITAEIGYSLTDSTPDGTWTWLAATHNASVTGNNDEYQLSLGTGLTPGTYYYASRFIKTGSSTYVYGGTAGVWNNDNGVLTVNALGEPVATAASPVGVTSFTANWNAVTDATSYEIDVYEQTTTFATDLFISEYVEGSSNNKYIEIYNGTGASVDLTDYDLVNYSNGSISPGAALALSGSLANGETFVIRNSSAVVWGGISDVSTASNAMTFNGNDVIALRYLGTNIDVVGTIGSSANFAINTTLTRNSAISSPTTTYTVSEWTSSPEDTVTNLGSHTFSGGSSTTFVIEDVNIGNVTSYEVNGLNPETTYHYVVRAVLGATTSANSNAIEVTTLSSTCTWNGTAWSNGTGPTFEIDAILQGAYDTSAEGGFTAKSLTVTTGGSLTIGADTSVTVVNELTNELSAAAVVISSDGSLIQQGTTNTNSGDVTVMRNSQDLMRLDYTMWSSPVATQNLGDFSPFTMTNRFYMYETDTDVYVTTANTSDFAVGQGYLIRTPNNHPTSPTSWLGQFIGLPNSGDLSIGLSVGGNGYNLVGNPYPSPISIGTLLSENNGVIAGNLYFWRKTNGAVGSAYISYSGGTFSDGAHAFDNIQPGQGFIVEATSAGSLSFTNTQRQAGNGIFYRNVNTTQSEGNSRIWLNVTANDLIVGQMAVGYTATASNDLDASDATYINDSAIALNSFVANTELAVQHRAAFEATDVVPLSFKTNTAGSYTIAINDVDGLFSNEAQTIFLKDNLLSIEHDLRTSAYTFISEIGSFTNRFEIVYESTLNVTTPDVFNQAIVFVKDAMLNVQTGSAMLSGIQVFDVQGRQVLDVKNINAFTYAASLNQISNGALVVKVITEDGIITTKKIIR